VASKPGGLNIKKCLQPRNRVPCRSRRMGHSRESRPGPNAGKAADWREETGKCTARPAGVGGQASREGFAANNVGKVLMTSRGWSKRQGLVLIADKAK
jgi:hypothetical protein